MLAAAPATAPLTLKIGALQIGEFGRGVLKLGIGTAVGQGAVLLASPLWSRLYDPQDFALLGLFLSFVNTATAVLALRYDLAIPLGARTADGPRLLILSLLLTGPIAVLSAGALALMTWQDVLGFGALPLSAAPVAALVLFVTGVFVALRYWHVGVGNFALISRSVAIQGIGRAVVPIVLAALHLGWLGLIAGEAVGRMLGIRRLAVPTLAAVRETLRQLSSAELWRCAWEYRRFPTIFLPSGFLDALAAAAAVPVFVTLHPLEAAGHFMLAQQVVAAPAALLCAALADVYHQKLMTIAQTAPQALVPLLWSSAARLLAVSLVALLLLALLAPAAAGWVFGRAWAQAGWLIAVLAPSTAVSIAASALSRAFVLSRIPHIKLVADVMKLVLPAAGILLGFAIGRSPLASATGYSIMYGVSYILYFVVIVHAVRPANLMVRA